MLRRLLVSITAAMSLAVCLGGCSSVSSVGAATSLFEQLGGMETVTQLGSGLLSSAMKDPRLASLLSKVNPAVAAPKVSNQLCSALGGGCAAPFTDAQIATAAGKLTPDQKTAVSDNFSSTLSSLVSNPAVRDAVTKALGPNLGGIVGAII